MFKIAKCNTKLIEASLCWKIPIRRILMSEELDQSTEIHMQFEEHEYSSKCFTFHLTVIISSILFTHKHLI
jgi:hypothetical protein